MYTVEHLIQKLSQYPKDTAVSVSLDIVDPIRIRMIDNVVMIFGDGSGDADIVTIQTAEAHLHPFHALKKNES